MKNLRIHFSLLLISVMLSGMLLCGCTEKIHKETAEIYALDTIINLTAYGKNSADAIDSAKAELTRLENLFSVTKTDSDISRINAAQGESVHVSADTFELIRAAVDASSITDGKFDITLCGVLKLWGFTEAEHRVPTQKEIAAELKNSGFGKIRLSTPDEVSLPKGMRLDTGGIAKGYIGDRLAAVMKNAGCDYGVISLGGNIRTLGTKPDGEPFVVGIQHPDSEGYFATLETGEVSVITSGAYQRYFEADGKIYHHILNPESGYPAESNIESVTIVGTDGALCDALSTAVFVGGSAYAEELRVALNSFEYVIMNTDGKVLVSSGLKDDFAASDSYGNLDIIYI